MTKSEIVHTINDCIRTLHNDQSLIDGSFSDESIGKLFEKKIGQIIDEDYIALILYEMISMHIDFLIRIFASSEKDVVSGFLIYMRNTSPSVKEVLTLMDDIMTMCEQKQPTHVLFDRILSEIRVGDMYCFGKAIRIIAVLSKLTKEFEKWKELNYALVEE